MPKFYTVSEVAKALRVNRNKIYEYIENKQLKATKIGTLKIKEEWLNEFIESQINTYNEVA